MKRILGECWSNHKVLLFFRGGNPMEYLELTKEEEKDYICLLYTSGQGKRISLSAEQLKLTAKSSIGIPSVAEEIQIRHLVSQIELLENNFLR